MQQLQSNTSNSQTPQNQAQTNQIQQRSQADLIGQNFSSLRSKEEFLKRSRTSAPTKFAEQGSLLSQRNQCQTCKVQFTNEDYQQKIYRTCINCQERSICRSHIQTFKGLTTKCDLCFGQYAKMQDFILPPQTREEARQIQLQKEAAGIQKVQDIDNRVLQQYDLMNRSNQQQELSQNLGQQDLQYEQIQTQNLRSQQQELDRINRQVQEQVTQDMRQQQQQREAYERQELQRQEQERQAIEERQRQQENIDQANAQREHGEEMDVIKAQLYNEGIATSSWFWSFAFFILVVLIMIQGEILHANMIPQDQKLIIYQSRFDNYKNGFKNHFERHPLMQSQDIRQNEERVQSIFKVLDRDQGNQYQLSLNQIKDEINQHIHEMESMYGFFKEQTSDQDLQYMQLVVQELRKFQNYIEKEQYLRQRY